MDTLHRIGSFLYSDRSNAYKSALNTAFWVFLSSFIGAATGFLDQLNEWVQGDNAEIVDDLTVLGKAAFSAGVSSSVALLQYALRFGQSKGKLPGQGPVYPTAQEKQAKRVAKQEKKSLGRKKTTKIEAPPPPPPPNNWPPPTG